MMNSKIWGFNVAAVLGVAVLSFSMASGAQAAEPSKKGTVYVTGAAGMMMPEDRTGTSNGINVTGEMDPGPYANLGLGYYVARNLRLEGELSYGKTDYKNISGNGATVQLNGDLSLIGLTGAAYVDLAQHKGVAWYVGAGGGYVQWESSQITATLNGTTVATSAGQSETDLTVFGETGVSIGVADNLALVPAYRYQWLNTGTTVWDDDAAHIFKLGLRYDLN